MNHLKVRALEQLLNSLLSAFAYGYGCLWEFAVILERFVT